MLIYPLYLTNFFFVIKIPVKRISPISTINCLLSIKYFNPLYAEDKETS